VAVSSNQPFLATIYPSSAPEQTSTKVTFTNNRPQSTTSLVRNNSVIAGAQRIANKVATPLRVIFPNIQNQPILVAWPLVEDESELGSTPQPVGQPETWKMKIQDSPARDITPLQTQNDDRGMMARDDSNQSSSQQFLRYSTPQEMQDLIRHIEEEQWKARAAATYERPRNPGECFADPNWHPYLCFSCKQTRNTWKEFKNHIEVDHSIIMKDKIGAWECFHPTCHKLFGDRVKGVQHAMEEHWRAFRTHLPPGVDEYGRTYGEDDWEIMSDDAVRKPVKREL
jgi:hypothetical protein